MTETAIRENRVAIIGLGLLGASLGMALRGRGYHRLGWTRRPEVRRWAVANDVVEETADDVETILAQADITILCLPVPAINAFLQTHAAAWRPGAIVTDIGSVKEIIVNCGEKFLQPRGVHFVGSHPMAGTEKTGPYAAFPTLYEHAEVFVTSTPATNPEAMAAIQRLWEKLNTSIVRLGIREHDVLVAHTSHVAHLLAMALTEQVLDCPPEEQLLRFSGCATGFRDTSRIASSSPQMWREIIENNQDAVLETVKAFEERWHQLRLILENKQFDQFEQEFAKGKALRDSWIKYKNEHSNCKW